MPEIWEVESEYHRAVKLLKEGKYKEAKEIFIKYVDQNPYDQHAWEKLEECYLGLYKRWKKTNLKIALEYLHAAMICLRCAMRSSLKTEFKPAIAYL